MVQVLATIFFSTAAVGALGVIVTSFAEEFDMVRMALGLARPAPALHAARARVRRVEPARGRFMPAGLPLRAVA